MGNVLDILEQRLHFRKVIRPAAPREDRATVRHERYDLDILFKQNLYFLGLFALTGQGDVAKFHIQGVPKFRGVFPDQAVSLRIVPGEGEKGAAVHSFQGFLHVLACHHAAVILLENHVDGLAKLTDLNHRQRADNRNDGEQPAKSQH